MRSACVFCLTLALVAGLATAAPINYAEPADLSNSDAAPTALGALDIGANVIAGGIAFIFDGGNVADRADAFSFTLPGGLTIVSISIVITNYTPDPFFDEGSADGIGAISFAEIFNGDGTFPPTTGDLPSTDPSPYTFVLSGNAELGLSYDWQVTINVTGRQSIPTSSGPVPEPGTFVLAGAGLVLLWRRRRRR